MSPNSDRMGTEQGPGEDQNTARMDSLMETKLEPPTVQKAGHQGYRLE